MLKPLKRPDDISLFIHVEDYRHLSDEEIIEKVKAGITPLFEVLMRRYNQRLYRIQRSYISDEDVLDDTLQSTYIKAFEHLDSFRGEAQFSTWITRIAINEALKHLRRQKRFIRLRLAEENRAADDQPVEGHILEEAAGGREQNPEDETIQKDYKELLETLVDRLPPKYRAVYIMRELEGMNTRETADCLDLTPANIKVRLFRARQMLQEEIRREVSDAEIYDFMGVRCDRLVRVVMRRIDPPLTDSAPRVTSGHIKAAPAKIPPGPLFLGRGFYVNRTPGGIRR